MLLINMLSPNEVFLMVLRYENFRAKNTCSVQLTFFRNHYDPQSGNLPEIPLFLYLKEKKVYSSFKATPDEYLFI